MRGNCWIPIVSHQRSFLGSQTKQRGGIVLCERFPGREQFADIDELARPVDDKVEQRTLVQTHLGEIAAGVIRMTLHGLASYGLNQLFKLSVRIGEIGGACGRTLTIKP